MWGPMTYLSLNGIPFEELDEVKSNGFYFYLDGLGGWKLNKNDFSYEIEKLIIDINRMFERKIFANKEELYAVKKACHEFLWTTGLDSESLLDKENFERLIRILDEKDFPTNKVLYMFDCQNLVSSIHQCNIQVLQMVSEFYKTLNLEKLTTPEFRENDGLRCISSPIALKLHSFLNFIFIRLHSILDYITKLALELENIKTDFSKYPKLYSKNILYAQKNKIKLKGVTNTLFYKDILINKIESIRNKIIHNGVLDTNLKVYELIEGGKCIEKFILFPDFNEQGYLISFVNRDLFYSKENKINLQLVEIILQFQEILKNTLECINDNIN